MRQRLPFCCAAAKCGFYGLLVILDVSTKAGIQSIGRLDSRFSGWMEGVAVF